MKQRHPLMNQADASPGGGTPPAAAASAPATPPAPQANGAPAASLDPEAIKAIATAVTASVRDSVFAEARRTGLLGKKPASSNGESTAAAPAPDPGPVNFRPLDRAISLSGRQLDERAYNRIEKSFAEERPENATEWLADYFNGLGGTPAPAAPATTTQQTATTAGSSALVTNRGTPPPPQVPIEERPILGSDSRPGMSNEDINHLIKTKGVRYYQEKLAREKKALGSVRIR